MTFRLEQRATSRLGSTTWLVVARFLPEYVFAEPVNGGAVIVEIGACQ